MVLGQVVNASPFRDHAVIVTGASSGIGRELTYQLADQGAQLSLAARDVERLEAVATECRRRGARVLVVPTDVSEQSQCRRLIERTVQEYGRIDILINNAGVGMIAKFVEIQDPALLDRVMQVNYMGSVYCTYYALPFLKRTRGRLVAVSSVLGKAGVPTRSGYAASKHAMAGFFDSLRIELAEHGIAVTVIYPGFVATEVRQRALGPDGRPAGKSFDREHGVMAPEVCARLILRAAARRKREVVMTLRARLGLWLKLIAPGLVDRMAARAIQEE